MAGRKLRCRTVNDDAEDRNRMWTHIYSKKKESNRFLQLTGFFFVSFETGGLLPSFFCSADLSSSRTWSYEDRNRMGTRIYLKKEKRVQLISAVQPTFYRVELGLVEFRVEWEGVDDVESHPRAGWLFGGSRWEPKWPSPCLGKAAACAAAALFSFWPRLRGRRRPPGSCDAGRRRSVIYGPAGRVSLSLSLFACSRVCLRVCVCGFVPSIRIRREAALFLPNMAVTGRFSRDFEFVFFLFFMFCRWRLFVLFGSNRARLFCEQFFVPSKVWSRSPHFGWVVDEDPAISIENSLHSFWFLEKKRMKNDRHSIWLSSRWTPLTPNAPRVCRAPSVFFSFFFFCSFFPASFLYRSINRTRSLNWTPR